MVPLLESFVGRQELVETIKGYTKFCAFQVFSIASLSYIGTLEVEDIPSKEIEVEKANTVCRVEDDASNPQKKEPLGLENMMLSSLEKLLPIVLNLPDVNMRLKKIIKKLYENHPPCPQLYLYSSGDKVVPSHSVEQRIKEQQKMGRNIHSFNFRDHCRNFLDLYSQLHNFLQKCFTPTKLEKAEKRKQPAEEEAL
ncbi:hypothetical protein EUTSA_v10023063mg [Eutrema salsugineum]|uniref:Uncharacterized protein n=1 Tax=Eutrema salsugineum TaxID=72664 RepID=V4M6E9_EUTSA|nr:hypothetical protein EUTSA_v10023063mg [Eutrema salsugineum]